MNSALTKEDNMKKAVNILGVVGRIVNIFLMTLYLILSLVASGVTSTDTSIAMGLALAALFLASLIIALNAQKKIKTGATHKTPGILLIVAGVVGVNPFYVVSGILYLISASKVAGYPQTDSGNRRVGSGYVPSSRPVRVQDGFADILFDSENEDPIEMTNADGERYRFDQVAIIPIGDDFFCILKPIDRVDGIKDDEVVVFFIGENSYGENELYLVEERDVAEEVMKRFYRLLEEQE